MRKVGAVLSFFVALGLLVPPAFAQAPAAAPAPKVTINGLVDFVTSISKNWSGQGAGVGNDVTDGGKDKMWYSRERGVFTLTGEVGRSKGVWALELDFVNGAGLTNTGTTAGGNSANFDLDTDVGGFTETKWLYVETPITGPGSLLPFIPVSSIIRGGAQPARGHDYKAGLQFGGDFPGVTIETSWAPNLRSTLTYAQIGESLDHVVAPTQNEDWAFLGSVEFDIFKGLTVKPTYSYARFDGGSCGSAALSTQRKNGFDTNLCTAPASNNLDTRRHTIGGDVRWTMGPITVQPTVLYQFGDQQIKPGIGGVPANQTARDVDINAWIFDTTVGFRTGPLNITGRGMYTPGMKARHLVQNGADVGYYQPINSGFGYFGGFTEIWTGGIEYNTALLVGSGGVTLRESPSYDKYGRLMVALALDYALTPALTFNGLVSGAWTAEKVDTNGVLSSTGMSNADGRGDERFLGVETNAGLTYRFAPNVQFDLIGAILFAGSALDHARTAGGPVKDADNVYKTVARIRFTF